MNREAYEFLNSARVLHWQFLKEKAKRDELNLCLLPSGIRYDKDKVQTSPEDTVSKIVAEISVIEKRMEELLVLRAKRIEEISNVLEKLPDNERTALMLRFIGRYSVSKIAENMGYSESTVYRYMDQGGATIVRKKMIKIIK